MTSAEARSSGKIPAWLRLPFRWLWALVWTLIRVLALTWGTLAIYYSNLPWEWLRIVAAGAFLIFGVVALFFRRPRRTRVAFAMVYVAVIVWWIFIPPTHQRTWRTDVAVLPKAIVDGDRVRLTGVRHFDYRNRHDFTTRYEEREVQFSHLTGVDLFVSYWKIGPVGHTFVSFNFDNALPVCISIETRPESHEGYDPIASLFKQYELIYVVGDERDIVRLRTDHRDEDVFLYPIQIPVESARQLFLIYLDRINNIEKYAEWYHLLKSSCTINIVRYANLVGRVGRWDVRLILNGWVDRYLYYQGYVNTSLPFEELRRRSHINEASHAAGDAEDFSKQIRANLP